MHRIKYRQCSRCVMDSSDPEITFNSKGYCNHCSEFFGNRTLNTYQGIKSDGILKKMVAQIKKSGVNKKYDCVVGVSGGVDSCYTAYICKQNNLRVLLVHLDNGWDTETSSNNIESISKALDLDLETFVLNWEEFKDIQLSHLRASIPEIETPTDIAILECLHKAATKHSIKYIIMGGNYVSESILPKSWHYNAKDKKYSKIIHSLYGNRKVTHFPSFNYWQEAYYKFIKRVKIFYILNYVNYNKQGATESLRNIGWREYGEKHHESFYTRIVQSYILPVKFNIDYRRATLSNKICSFEITREEALEILRRKPYDELKIEDEIDYVCKKLEISRDEFNTIMKRKPHFYDAYPNEKFKLELFYRFYRHMANS